MLNDNQHFHFIGICGIGMSGIAKILLQQGFKVSGCDAQIDEQRATELQSLGCMISTHQSPNCHNPAISTLIRSSDVPLTHPEIVRAEQKNITIRLRAEILAKIMQEKISIAVAGAHGKTTTTSLLAHVLLQAHAHPTIIVGGHMHEINSNAQLGSGKFLVAESDESDRSFLLLPKTYSIVTNIDREHLNTYKDFAEIQQTFVQFLNQLPTDGCNVICLDDPGIQSILPKIETPFLTYGTTPQADFYIHNIKLFPDFSEFEVKRMDQQSLGVFKVSLPGMHNVLNASGVIALCLQLGIDLQAIKNGLQSFQGVDRRFTRKGISKNQGAIIFDDYGHHPRELAVTFQVAQTKAQGKIVVIFQPQRFSRTKHLWDDFVQTLAHAPIDHLILTDIYAASEPAVAGITSQNLALAIQTCNPKAQVQFIPFGDHGEQILQTLDDLLEKDDLVLFQGAGKVNKLIKYLLA